MRYSRGVMAERSAEYAEAFEESPPVLTAGEDVPPEYRAMVEEYYRRLAERRR
jgi:hypothetical protein